MKCCSRTSQSSRTHYSGRKHWHILRERIRSRHLLLFQACQWFPNPVSWAHFHNRCFCYGNVQRHQLRSPVSVPPAFLRSSRRSARWLRPATTCPRLKRAPLSISASSGQRRWPCPTAGSEAQCPGVLAHDRGVQWARKRWVRADCASHHKTNEAQDGELGTSAQVSYHNFIRFLSPRSTSCPACAIKYGAPHCDRSVSMP